MRTNHPTQACCMDLNPGNCIQYAVNLHKEQSMNSAAPKGMPQHWVPESTRILLILEALAALMLLFAPLSFSIQAKIISHVLVLQP